MNEFDPLLPWEQDGWLAQAAAWSEAQLEVHRWRIAKPLELLHQRAWSAFGRVMTDHGTAYFKAPAPAFRYEAAVTQVLERLRPDCTTPLLAVDLARGWILSADAGPKPSSFQAPRAVSGLGAGVAAGFPARGRVFAGPSLAIALTH